MTCTELLLASALLHAVWNLMAKTERIAPVFFLQVALVIAVLGAGPAAWGVVHGALPGQAATWMVAAAMLKALYLLALTLAYREGDFSVVYPVAKGLTVLLLAFVDVWRGRIPYGPGIALVVAGCMAVSGRAPQRWLTLTALAGAAYLACDKVAAEHLALGPGATATYGVCQFAVLAVCYRLLVRQPVPPFSDRTWKTAGGAALLVFTSHWLAVWASQLTPYASYVAAVRHVSIVIGVALSAVVLREAAPVRRLAASAAILMGVISLR
ncbi:MAG TPA: hypothetical protein VGO93_06845 [Candidatus Xenobia bacterium]